MTVSAYENLIFDAEHQLGLDVYQDNTRRQAVLTRPAVILIHGGGWFCGDKSGEADIATWLAENGYLVIAPNYRLYRQAQYPGAYTDVFNVYRWLQNSSLEFNHDRIGAYGYSAGGTMAVALSNSYGIPVVSLSGVYDIAGWMEKTGTLLP